MTDKQIKKYMGFQIKVRRESLNLKQEDIGRALKLSRVSILNMESGRHSPKCNAILTLCGIFNCTPNDLYPNSNGVKYAIEEKTVTVKKKRKVLKLIK